MKGLFHISIYFSPPANDFLICETFRRSCKKGKEEEVKEGGNKVHSFPPSPWRGRSGIMLAMLTWCGLLSALPRVRKKRGGGGTLIPPHPHRQVNFCHPRIAGCRSVGRGRKRTEYLHMVVGPWRNLLRSGFCLLPSTPSPMADGGGGGKRWGAFFKSEGKPWGPNLLAGDISLEQGGGGDEKKINPIFQLYRTLS